MGRCQNEIARLASDSRKEIILRCCFDLKCMTYNAIERDMLHTAADNDGKKVVDATIATFRLHEAVL